jgi:hypothetical protein
VTATYSLAPLASSSFAQALHSDATAALDALTTLVPTRTVSVAHDVSGRSVARPPVYQGSALVTAVAAAAPGLIPTRAISGSDARSDVGQAPAAAAASAAERVLIASEKRNAVAAAAEPVVLGSFAATLERMAGLAMDSLTVPF